MISLGGNVKRNYLVLGIFLFISLSEMTINGIEPNNKASIDKSRRKLALTFDDAPFPSTKFFSTSERTAAILRQLSEAKCPSVGVFTVGQYIQEFGDNEIQAYDDAGHIICNHSYSHYALSNTSAREFVADIKLADARINSYKGFRKYFRFPYLDYSESPKTSHVKLALKSMGYQDGYVTILTQDWHINSIFLNSKSSLPFESFKKMYVQTIVECAAFSDYLTTRYKRGCPVQILLLHENDLNAFCAFDIINALRDQGWEIVSIEEAYHENKDFFEQQRHGEDEEFGPFFLNHKSVLMDLEVLDRKFFVTDK